MGGTNIELSMIYRRVVHPSYIPLVHAWVQINKCTPIWRWICTGLTMMNLLAMRRRAPRSVTAGSDYRQTSLADRPRNDTDTVDLTLTRIILSLLLLLLLLLFSLSFRLLTLLTNRVGRTRFLGIRPLRPIPDGMTGDR